MPIHFEDRDVVAEAGGLKSALIVPCNLCPAVTVAVREKRPFMQLFKGPLTSAPFREYLEELRTRLKDAGVRTKVFESRIYHQWFLCMWTDGRRRKLRREAKGHDAVIVLGCESATETVRGVLEESETRVIEGMKVAGIMNGKLSFSLPGDVSFKDCRIVPMSHQEVA